MKREMLLRLCIPVISVVIAGLLSLTTIHQWVENWVLDSQKNFVAKEYYFEDSVVLDIDDVSLKRLEPHLGNWPYQRDTYSLILNYLTQMGAQKVVFDILFAESRDKDASFKDALEENKNVVLVAGAPAIEMPLTDTEKLRLQSLSWAVDSSVPVVNLTSIVLPNSSLVGEVNQGQRVGVISASSDQDGILRRLPMLYNIAGNTLPSLPLRIVSYDDAKPVVNFDNAEHVLEIGQYQWPIDEKGLLHLYFPKNANSILSVPFYRVAEAALGIETVDNAKDFFEGKTVYIGSTAYLSDRVNTPRGAMAGTYVLAITQETMKRGLVYQPARVGFDLLLLLLALSPAFILVVKSEISLKQRMLIPLTALVLLFIVNALLLNAYQLESHILTAVEVVLLSTLLSFIYHQYREKRHNQALLMRNEELNLVANTDTLTTLFNRRAFTNAFHQEMQRVQRLDIGYPSIAIMDLDHFKHVNDTYGHDVGDEVLKTFSAVIKKSLRSIDVPGRWGGEEFVVLLPNSKQDEAKIVLERIRKMMSETEIKTDDGTFHVTVSIGLSEINKRDIALEEAIKIADNALYQAKQTGRNTICLAR